MEYKNYYDKYFGNKYPEIFNNLKSKVGDMFTPYSAIPKVDELLYEPKYTASKNYFGKLVETTPDKYIEEALKGFNSLTKNYGGKAITLDDMINHRMVDGSMDNLLQMNAKGDKYWLPYLEYGKYEGGPIFEQEGLHRALTLKKMGIDKMPVVIANRGTKDGLKRVVSKALRIGKLLNAMPTDPWSMSDMLKMGGNDVRAVFGSKKEKNKMLQEINEAGYTVERQPDGTLLFKI